MLYRFLNTSYKQVITARLNGSGRNVSVPDGGGAAASLIEAMFTLLGKVAKLNGPITQDDVNHASEVMSIMGLNERGRQTAIEHFNLGKRPFTDVMPVLEKMVKHIGQRNELALQFLKIQCQGACINDGMGLQGKMILRDTAEVFGYSKTEFEGICIGARAFFESCNRSPQDLSPVSEAYNVLQLAPGVADEEIKRAYLRLVSRHHPDKLGQQNLSEDALSAARDKFTAVRSAYEVVCGIRKLRA